MSKVFSHCYIAESGDNATCFEDNRLYFRDYKTVEELLTKADNILKRLEVEHYPRQFNLVIHRY
jgi:hypothetical protein